MRSTQLLSNNHTFGESEDHACGCAEELVAEMLPTACEWSPIPSTRSLPADASPFNR